MILILLFAYAVLFMINTNHVEKRMIYALLTDGDWNTVSTHPVSFTPNYVEYLTAPLYFDKNRLTKVSHGEIFNAYCFTTRYAKIQQRMQSKLFWNEYFTRNGLRVPTLYATTHPFEVMTPMEPDTTYICKPEYGTTGNDISLVRGADVRPTDVNMLIQQKVNSCDYDGSRTFRVITTYDGDLLIAYEFRNDDTIVSNLVKGSTSRTCEDIPREIEETVRTLRALHARDFTFAFSIGWDIMLDCDGTYVLEGNWPSGLFGDRKNTDAFIEDIMVRVDAFHQRASM